MPVWPVGTVAVNATDAPTVMGEPGEAPRETEPAVGLMVSSSTMLDDALELAAVRVIG